MNASYSSGNRQPLFFVAFVLIVLGFAIGYAAGSAGLTGGQLGGPMGGPAATEDGITCFFSPKGGCTSTVVEQVDQAKQSIEVQAYSFTSKEIVAALIDAHHRGVKITIVLDKSNLKEVSGVNDVYGDKIPTFIDPVHAIAHNKIMLIDGATIITGSFNFTRSAEHSNAENLLVIHNHPKLYAAYDANFHHHLEPFRGLYGRRNARIVQPQGFSLVRFYTLLV